MAGNKHRYTRLQALSLLLALVVASPPGQATELKVVSPTEFRAALLAERGSVLVLNFWASWCSPCLKEIPELLRLERDYASCGVRVLGITLDEPTDYAAVVKPLLAQRFAGFRTLARDSASMDAFASVVDGAWNELMPTSYVLDRDGVVIERIQGGKSYEEFAALVRPLARCP